MTRLVALLALPGVQLLDVSGPLDVFAQANIEAGKSYYELCVLAVRPGPIRSSSGVRLMPDATLATLDQRLDTLLVAGGPDACHTRLSPAIVQWLRTHAKQSRRFGSVCTGAFFLADAGLLDGRRATTHWAVAQQLAERYPKVNVDESALYVRDGKLWTAAGVTAGLDLALTLVEEDLGREIAMRVASQLVMFFKRPGGQVQFSRKGHTQPVGRSVLQEVQRWVVANPALRHDVASLAERAGLSPRHFARLFQAELGVTPASWVELARITAARHLLESATASPKQVAALCGFNSINTFRRAFSRHVGVSPTQYRNQCRVE